MENDLAVIIIIMRMLVLHTALIGETMKTVWFVVREVIDLNGHHATFDICTFKHIQPMNQLFLTKDAFKIEMTTILLQP